MILNENVSGRLSAGWLLPLVLTGLGLFATPVLAQGEEPARIEVTVNGKSLRELSPEERQAAIDELVRAQSRAAEKRDGHRTPKAKPKPKIEPRPEPEDEPKEEKDEKGEAPSLEVRGLVQQGLAEARREIANDKDLAELGITDQVSSLLDAIGSGGDFEGALERVMRGAMKGAGRMAIKEIRKDPDLRRLGLTGGVEQLVHGLLDNPHNQELLMGFVKQAMQSAKQEAKAEIRGDAELQKLGITEDVSKLVDGILSGNGDMSESLQQIVEKAMRAAQKHGDDDDGDDEAPKPKPAKAKKVLRKD